MANALQVIASRLLLALMGSDRRISCSSSQILTILIGDMFTRAILVAFGKTKVNNVDVVTGRFSSANQEIIRLDISMDNSLGMNLLEMFHQLNGYQEHGFDVQLTLA